MADYYPLLARALDALPDRTPALRKAVYDRARSALIGQLRNLDPPVPEADIELERKALDAAIERLEAGYGAAPAAPAVTPAPAPPPPPAEPKPAAKPAATPEPKPAPVSPPPPSPEATPPKATEAKPADVKPVALAKTEQPKPPAEPKPAAPQKKPAPEPLPPATLPADLLPEPGPPVDAQPFVPPPRRPKPEERAEPRPEAAGFIPTVPTAENEDTAAEGANGRQRPRIDVVARPAGRSRMLRNLFVGGVLASVIALIAVTAFFLRDRPSDLQRTIAETQGGDPAETPDAKFADRVGGEAEPKPKPAAPGASPAQPEVAVSQRAVLYEENTADPRAQPAAISGHAIWRLDTVAGEQGEPLQTVLRATVEYPEAGLTLGMTIRRNRDATLPASHTIELAFTNYGSGAKRAVQNVGLLQPKEEEASRGSPVSGLPVRVRENLFLIGLSSLKSDVDRNTDLLLHRNWFDLPISYASGTRAILTFEKGNSGTRAMQAAFDAWKD
ncbi:histidine kinase [Methylorubrum sp. SB2]|uniref:histidine kinase n=1 Tax=Methylorubrum subtropicum TaxID=3138812 RepID=UPI00313B9621